VICFTRLRRSLLAVALLGAGYLTAAPAPARVAAQAERASAHVLVREDFDKNHAALDFDTSGPGRWRVHHGTYRLMASRGRASRDASRTRMPMSLHRNAISGDSWTVSALVRPRGRVADASLVVGHEENGDFVEVHLSSGPAGSGVYRVRDGRRTELSALSGLDVAPRMPVEVSVRHHGRRLVVLAARLGSRLKRVASANTGSTVLSRVGFGSHGGSSFFDNLLVRVRPTHDDGGGRAVFVRTSDELTAALAGARPGDVITMASGVYTTKGLEAPLVLGGKQYYGTFVASRSGTPSAPIRLQGPRSAVIDGKPGADGTGTQYGLYVAGADWFQVSGITVQNVSKGVVTDQADHVLVDDLLVQDIGDEGIHLRSFSRSGVVSDNTVRRTGLGSPTFGEGIYVGSANSNWGTYSNGQPDASDGAVIAGNRISATGAESMDIKEGTTGGVIRGNTFDGSGMTGSFADSWIDLKGNGWLVSDNHGTNALEDGFQVHQALIGWGDDNVFRDNVATVNGPGYGFWLQKEVTGTVVSCDNEVEGAASGFATVPCTPARDSR
jgi:hypothetical protein